MIHCIEFLPLAPSDYSSFSTVLTVRSDSPTTVNITIIDDNLAEGNQRFFGRLFQEPARVILSPDQADVIIRDAGE